APRRPAARSSGLLASDGGAPAPRRPAARSSGLLASDGGAPAPRRPAARTARAVFGRAGDGAGRAGAAPGDRSRPPSRGLRSDQCRTRPPPRGGRRRAMLILELVLNGILLGALYACVGISFSLIWGVMNIINLAHE